jgi:hypothetical protein
VGANSLQAQLHRLIYCGGFIRCNSYYLQQLNERRLPVEGYLSFFSLGDIAPRPNDLDRIAVFVATQAQVVADPTIRPVLAAETVFVRVAAQLKKTRELGRDTGKVLRVDPFQPEVRAF